MKRFGIFLLTVFMYGCGDSPGPLITSSGLISSLPSIEGRKEYLQSPFVTAGTRVYMTGYQDGSFPDLGWHVKGEMGGIWDHPIKLMDGFYITINGKCLEDANRFVNYPVANEHMNQFDDLEIDRLQYVPDSIEGLVIQYRIKNQSHSVKNIDLKFYGLVDLSPVWLSERKGITDGYDHVRFFTPEQAMVAKDSINEWHLVFGSESKADGSEIGKCSCYEKRNGNGKDASLLYKISIPPKGDVTQVFFISGSSESRDKALNQYRYLKNNHVSVLKTKIEYYASLAKTAAIQIPDTSIQQMYDWLKFNTQWLVRDVPPIGIGLSAGLPDYPWWFGCDNSYALQGLLCTGQHDLVLSTIRLLHNLSEGHNGNGRMIHEVSTNGVVYNPGNVNETPQFIMLLWDYFQWTGDLETLKELFPFVKKGLIWLAAQDKDGNLYPDGGGMMEIQGLDSEMIDVAVYTQKALEYAAEMSLIMNDTLLSGQYAKSAQELKLKINSEWWVEQSQSFADFRANRFQTIELIDQTISRAEELDKPWAVAELGNLKNEVLKEKSDSTKGYVVHHNWVVNTPMETGIADSSRAIKALETARSFTNPFGMYVTGIDRDENIKDLKVEAMRKKVFSYTGAVMTLPTGVQAVAECRYGQKNAALDYIKKLSKSFSYALPGSMYEVSPDFGMMVQAWSIYGVAVPIVRYFFGISPEAYKRKISITPNLPNEWKQASLSYLPVGNNMISIKIDESVTGNVYHISQIQDDWTIELKIPVEKGKIVKVNEKEINCKISGNQYIIRLAGEENEVSVK